MNNRTVRKVVLCFSAAVVLIACGCDDNKSAYPTKEYVLAANTLAADSMDDFATLADAASHHDTTGVLSLEGQGKAFMLAPGTRIMAGGITGGVCGGTVESGEFISKDVVLACAQLGE